MSRYGLDKALWLAIRRREGETDLTDDERRAFEECDVRALYSLGAIPFLIYQYALGKAGGFSVEFVGDYVEQLRGLEPVDTAT
jgi:hypothetical protein